MGEFYNVKGEETFIGKNKIVEEYLADKITGSELVYEKTFSLTVDTDYELFLDLIKDLHIDIKLMSIKSIEGYSNIPTSKYIRKFEKGITKIDFNVIGAIDKIPIINRIKINGLGIKLDVKSN